MSESATIEVLTAQVRVLMVGNRQVTLSVFAQLDSVAPDKIKPFGRVRDRVKHGQVTVIGSDENGQLVRSEMNDPHGWTFYATINKDGSIKEDQADDYNKKIFKHEFSGKIFNVWITDERSQNRYDFNDEEMMRRLRSYLNFEAARILKAAELFRSLNGLPLIVLAGLK